MPVAVVTGASRGLGRALALDLAKRGWSLLIDARSEAELSRTAAELRQAAGQGEGQTAMESAVVALSGSVADARHREALRDAAGVHGALDLLVNNASELGPSPQPRLADYPLEEFERVFGVNVTAPLGLVQKLLPLLRQSGGRIVNITSDAAVEPYEGWGGYGASKAALDQWTAILAVEEPTIRVYAFDPGDMHTDMHQRAFPGEDISDRPEPETVVPALLRLVEEAMPSGRYTATALRPAQVAEVTA